MPRRKRVRSECGSGMYHVMSRVIEGRFILNDEAKSVFYKIMRQVEAFSGVKVLTYAIMSNHFHILLEEGLRENLEKVISEDEVMRRTEGLLSDRAFYQLSTRIRQLRRKGRESEVKEIFEGLRVRMHDVSEFMKTLKQKFTQWYNRRMGRKGTIWEDRYKSVLVERKPNAMVAIAAYIELNPVRAGMVDDPKDYRWSGYGEAMGAGKKGELAREGIQFIAEYWGRMDSWNTARALYRKWIYQNGVAGQMDVSFVPSKGGFSKAEVDQVFEEKGELPWFVLVRCRMRYFTEGVAIGSKEFVKGLGEELFEAEKRKREVKSPELRVEGIEDLAVYQPLRL